MSLEMMERFISSSLPATERLIGILLGNRHNGRTGQCNPSTARLAEESGLTRRAVEKVIQRLETGGHITVLRTPGMRNSYKLHPQDLRTTFACEQNSPANPVHETCEPDSHPPANGVRTTCEPASHEPKGTVSKTGREPEVSAQKVLPSTHDGDFKAACHCTLDLTASPALHTAWSEWQHYRRGRHTAKGPDRLRWTHQAARLSAAQVVKAMEQHGEQTVIHRITAAIAGHWQGLNLDKLDTARSTPTSAARSNTLHYSTTANIPF